MRNIYGNNLCKPLDSWNDRDWVNFEAITCKLIKDNLDSDFNQKSFDKFTTGDWELLNREPLNKLQLIHCHCVREGKQDDNNKKSWCPVDPNWDPRNSRIMKNGLKGNLTHFGLCVRQDDKKPIKGKSLSPRA